MTVICATCMSLFAQERTTKASQYPQATIVKKYSPLTKATGWYYDKSADEWVDGDRQIFAGNYWKNKKLAEGTNLPTFENISVIEVTYDGKTYVVLSIKRPYYKDGQKVYEYNIAATSIEFWQKIYNLDDSPVLIPFCSRKVVTPNSTIEAELNNLMHNYSEQISLNQCPLTLLCKKENDGVYRFRYAFNYEPDEIRFSWIDEYYECSAAQFDLLRPASLKR